MNRSLIKITEIMCFEFYTYFILKVFDLEKKHLDLVHRMLFGLETHFDTKRIIQ